MEKIFSDSKKIASVSENAFPGGAECFLDEEEHFLDPSEYRLESGDKILGR
jgi:hypothetical protein